MCVMTAMLLNFHSVNQHTYNAAALSRFMERFVTQRGERCLGDRCCSTIISGTHGYV